MGYLQTLCDTYDAISNIAGKADVKPNGDTLVLSPLGHIRIETHISAILNENGNMINVRPELKIACAPSAIEAESRSSTTIAPYPLIDQLEYTAGDFVDYGGNNSEKFNKYIADLKAWSESDCSHPKIRAVYAYLSRKTLISDLIGKKLIIGEDKLLINKDRYAKQERKKLTGELGKLRVRFEVEIPNENETGVCEDESVQKLYANYYTLRLNKSEKQDLCYISGKKSAIAVSHPKNINRITANAKLISGNDSANFTYRGRFETPEQAATVSYEASQKAHQALRYLIDERGITCDTQAIIAFAVSKKSDVIEPYSDSRRIYVSGKDIYGYALDDGDDEPTDNEKRTKARAETAKDYADLLDKAIFRGSVKSIEPIKQYKRKIAVLATDAATSGRMSVVFYREFNEDEYLERLIEWHKACKWTQIFWDEKKERFVNYVGAPSIDSIIEATLGKPRGGGDRSYYKLKKNARKQLLQCILNGEKIPSDMLENALRRASNPLSCDEKSGYNNGAYNKILNAVCAIWRKHYIDIDHKKEVFEVQLEEDRDDREYLYGRLLAVADRIESHAMSIKEKKDEKNKRPTNALRYMAAFAQRPFNVWRTIYLQIVPYMQELNGANWYQNIIDDIEVKFKDGDYENNSPLDGRYLLGYSAQRYALRPTQQGKGNNNESTEQD
ncbi:MAG: type I-C CRISPR-associated protein Cas8c/Csd1 [Helicobacteraceae bacterium]|jgi:CRISPR-associated protein Csd1|nr:type I-C CRISPR-associated protein Cas8c/Csd1 [Helicobacteraceae bacterium]